MGGLVLHQELHMKQNHNCLYFSLCNYTGYFL